jgi:lipopolysaccharide export system protein LptA
MILSARVMAAAVVAVALSAPAALAQSQAGGTLQGFSQNRDKPITVRATSLEVRDKEKMATFTGDVHAIQGDMNLRCARLIVYYEGDVAKGDAPAPAEGQQQQQQIKLMKAEGNVVMSQKDQVVTGDTGEFDMRSNKGVVTGKVVLTQGPNVIRGGRALNVDMATGVYTVVAPTGGQLEMSIDSSKKPGADGKPLNPMSVLPSATPSSAPAAPAPRPGRKN